MKRLIDADEILKSEHQHYDYMSDEYYVLVRDIENAPTVDPVRHGHWIKRSKVYPGLPYDHTYHYECSNCGYMDTAGEDVEVPYCWHCGAKMDAPTQKSVGNALEALDEVTEDDNIDPYMYPCTMCEDFDGKGGCMSKGGCGERREDAET